ncbi:hypothetical protein ACWGQ9_25265 [Streptomyces parvus]
MAAITATVGTSSAAAAPLGATGTAPTCVTGWVSKGTLTQTGHARNDCNYNVRVKIVWAFGADGACHSLGKGGHLTSKVPIQPRRFDGINNC